MSRSYSTSTSDSDTPDHKPAVVRRNLSSASSSSSFNEEQGELTEEDKEIALLYELENIPEIACRYTEGDPEFANEMSTPLPPPPVVYPWAGPRAFGGGRGRGRGGGQWGDRDRNSGYKRQYDNREQRGQGDDRNRSHSHYGGQGGSSHYTPPGGGYYDKRRRDD